MLIFSSGIVPGQDHKRFLNSLGALLECFSITMSTFNFAFDVAKVDY